MGWLMDRRLPGFLRAFGVRTFARIVGADLNEARLRPGDYPSLGAFFVRELKTGARVFPDEPAGFGSPADGRLISAERITADTLLQAKGQPYSAAELLGPCGEGVDLGGALALNVYLSPSDYHRVHSPLSARLAAASWLGAARYSVAPKETARRPRVFVSNERVALRLEDDAGPCFLVLVGALNVGRMRVVGVEQGAAPTAGATFERGAELGRFEMGSTVVLILPHVPGRPAPEPLAGLELGAKVRMGQPLATRA